MSGTFGAVTEQCERTEYGKYHAGRRRGALPVLLPASKFLPRTGPPVRYVLLLLPFINGSDRGQVSNLDPDRHRLTPTLTTIGWPQAVATTPTSKRSRRSSPLHAVVHKTANASCCHQATDMPCRENADATHSKLFQHQCLF